MRRVICILIGLLLVLTMAGCRRTTNPLPNVSANPGLTFPPNPYPDVTILPSYTATYPTGILYTLMP